MSFHYVRDIYEKNQLAARLDKTDMIPKVNIIIGKASVASVNGTRGLGRALWALSMGVRVWSPLRKGLAWSTQIGLKQIWMWPKQLLFKTKNAQKNYYEWDYTYTVLKLRVKQVTYKSKIWQHKKAKATRYSAKNLKNLGILLENSEEGLGSRRMHNVWVMYLWEYTKKVTAPFPQQVVTTLLNGLRKGAVGS